METKSIFHKPNSPKESNQHFKIHTHMGSPLLKKAYIGSVTKIILVKRL